MAESTPMAKRKPASDPSVAEGKAVLYLEVPIYIKESLEKLARQHNRKITGECMEAFQRHLATFDLWPPPKE